MKKVLDMLGEKGNQNLLIEIRDWIVSNYPTIDISLYFSLPFILQLGIYLKFFESRNLYTMVTPNSYVIDYVNYEINGVTERKALDNIKKNNTPYEIAKYNLNTNDILVIYEMAILDMIIITNKIPF